MYANNVLEKFLQGVKYIESNLRGMGPEATIEEVNHNNVASVLNHIENTIQGIQNSLSAEYKHIPLDRIPVHQDIHVGIVPNSDILEPIISSSDGQIIEENNDVVKMAFNKEHVNIGSIGGEEDINRYRIQMKKNVEGIIKEANARMKKLTAYKKRNSISNNIQSGGPSANNASNGGHSNSYIGLLSSNNVVLSKEDINAIEMEVTNAIKKKLKPQRRDMEEGIHRHPIAHPDGQPHGNKASEMDYGHNSNSHHGDMNKEHKHHTSNQPHGRSKSIVTTNVKSRYSQPRNSLSS